MPSKFIWSCLITVVGAGLLLLAGLAPTTAQTSFYEASAADISDGPPGSLIRNAKDDVSVFGGSKYQVLYRSTGLKGEPIAVSGMVFVPPGNMPAGGWPIVAWAHPTSGLVSKCAPSMAAGGTGQVQGLEALLNAGYVVTATDYPGLGTAGPHPFLVGESEGRAVLDSIRAARELIGGKSPHAALWGHSQGGQAVLFAGEIAGQYAPDIDLVGVAAAAPATNLGLLMDDDINTGGGRNLLAMALYSWAEIYGAPIEKVVTADALKTVDSLAQDCLESIFDLPARYFDGQDLMKDFLSVSSITNIEPWKSLMEENSAGPLPAHLPVFLAQGTADDTVPETVTAGYMSTLCGAGSAVTMQLLLNVGHLYTAKDSAAAFVDWLTSIDAGKTVANNCP
ncbi:lipase [Devosia riboflavina]|uniref:Lipase n=1 Tax=Devosia riboflavina TaxID=46914 RepID=A0A087M6C1_9HYPH|nr:alpha/beta fold hydrolase [Devosia riboflavina]KFL32424.1 lipase [Devosia riboflavina]